MRPFIGRRLLLGSLRLINETPRRNVTGGESVEVTRKITAEDVLSFARVSGDFNPIHLDSEAASKTRFGRCIVHGALLNGIVSGVIASKLPGPGTVLISQFMEFTSPLYVGEEVKAKITITSVKRSLVECDYSCEAVSRQTVVMKGSAKLYFPSQSTSN